MRVALTIGASDPSSGAGIQMDLKVFQYLGIYGLTVLTAITSQSTVEFSNVFPLSEEVINSQFEVLLTDIKTNGAKIGMLYNKETINSVIKNIKKFNIKNLVVDPVITSTLGTKLIEEDALEFLKNELIPLSTAVTANILEAERLTGIKIEKIEDMYEASERLYKLGTSFAIIKGGHLDNKAVDILYDGKNFHKIDGKKISGEFHGTGCAFSSAFVSFLCKEYTAFEAFRASKALVRKAIENSIKLGHGIKLLILKEERNEQDSS
ncbi:MAG: bifunctional hydroxymethylpyrimidine kinase/phosphomethylpyrimidine kinase [Thermodesulfovibrio sp.]|nr:bifunctional hydroxymethylpyrimidine kinase/phosphomethylpyrimidine kinase [Thermodesulfovibrio sp.]MDW7998954.1 bifunctional hydroxymethylpyrimidine kinase/phosphomethylpyrimidine kinase [Thermodesulfovibrio sp.]